jgi:phosphatidylinositol-3-phosphatase
VNRWRVGGLLLALPLLVIASKQWVVVHHTMPAPVPVANGVCTGGPPPASYDHVIWIWMESHSASSVLGDPAGTYERQLASACGTETNDHPIASPSLPNYLGATSGETWGVTDDGSPAAHPITADNLLRQVRATNREERSYEEAMPSPCSLQDSGTYAVKHNPAPYYATAADQSACGQDDVPMGDLSNGNLATAIDQGTLPAFAFLTPDLCHDMHDCGVGPGDHWLSQWVPRLTAGPNYRAGRTVIFIAWDDPAPMALFVIAPSVPAGSTVSLSIDHYAELRTAEELLGVPLLGRAAGAVSLRAPFHL